jgi:hypothetical protein
MHRWTIALLLAVPMLTPGCAGERASPSAVVRPALAPSAVTVVDAAAPEAASEAGDAAPASVQTGDPAQVRQLFAVEAVDATDAVTGARVPVLLADSMLSVPSSGLYVLLDTEGRIGDAQVLMGRTRGWDRSAATPPLHVELQWMAPPSRDARRSLHVVAVGPLEDTLPRARLLRAGIARAGLAASAPDDSDHVHGPHGPALLAVDLDGDGEADVVAYQERRARRSAAPHTMSWDVQAATWLRASPSSSWQKVESCAWVDRTMVGP